MAKVFGHVRDMEGDFFVRSSDTTIKKLDVGDLVYEGDTLFGHQDNSRYDTLFVTLDEGLPFDVLLVGDESQCLDAMMAVNPFSEDETTISTTSLLAFSAEFSPSLPDESVSADNDEEEAASAEASEDEVEVIPEDDALLEVSEHKRTDEITDSNDRDVDLEALIKHAEEVTVSAYVSARMANEKAMAAHEAAAMAFKATDAALSSEADRSQKEAFEASLEATVAATRSREAADRLEERVYGVMDLLPESISLANMAANSAENASINAFNASIDSDMPLTGLVAMLTQSVQDAADAANIAARQTQEAAIIANNCAVALLENPDDQKIEEARLSQTVADLRASNAAASAAVAESVADRAEAVEVSQEMIRSARNAADNAESASVNARHAAEDSQTLIESIIQPHIKSSEDEVGMEEVDQESHTDMEESEVREMAKHDVKDTTDTSSEDKIVEDEAVAAEEKVMLDQDVHVGEILLGRADVLFGGRQMFTISIDFAFGFERTDVSQALSLIRQFDGQRLDLFLQIDADGKIRYGENGFDDQQQPLVCEMVSEHAIDMTASHNIIVVKEEATVMILVDGTLLFSDDSMTQSLKHASGVDIVIAEARPLSDEAGSVVTRLRLFDTALSMMEIAGMVSGSEMPTGVIVDIAFDAEMPSVDRSGNGHDAFLLFEEQTLMELIASSQDDLSIASEGL